MTCSHLICSSQSTLSRMAIDFKCLILLKANSVAHVLSDIWVFLKAQLQEGLSLSQGLWSKRRTIPAAMNFSVSMIVDLAL